MQDPPTGVSKIEDSLLEALDFAMNFLEEVTGQRATQEELASALKRYFVLNEIKEHITMEREGTEDNS